MLDTRLRVECDGRSQRTLHEVLFIANHAFGHKATGMRAAFIDRRPFGLTPYKPDLIVPTTTELAQAMT
jgi:hypothetical protein